MNDDNSPLSDRSLWAAIADQDQKLDRIASLGAQSVAQFERLLRHLNAKDALEAGAVRELRGIIAEARALHLQLRQPRSFADEQPATGAAIERVRRREDDTVSLVLHVGQARIKLSKKRIAFLFTLVGTAVGAAAHWLATLGAK